MRRDIQALRAFAVGAVVVYHLLPDTLTGGFVGVDVFFVISGFLITGHLLRRPPETWQDLTGFWLRRIRRLLPAAFTVLGVSLVGTLMFAPAGFVVRFVQEVIAATFYVLNWLLAGSAVDYLAADDPASAVQHYWSLSIEEQFYLVWPVLFVLLGWLAAKTKRVSATLMIGAGVGAVFAGSLWYSIWATLHTPASAYFVSPSRFWELAAGGLIAVALTAKPGLMLWASPGARILMAWLGFGGIVYTCLVYSSDTPFPGWTALLPVGSTALVILADAPRVSLLSPARVFGITPVQWLGDVSYSVYLWHWPLIALLPYALGRQLGGADLVAITVTTLVLSWGTKRQIEDRFRAPRRASSGQRLPYLVTAGGMAVMLVAGLGAIWVVNGSQGDARAQAAAMTEAQGECFGAAALAPGSDCEPTQEVPVAPSVVDAPRDVSVVYQDSCLEYPPFERVRTCEYGAIDGEISVALVGNSHAAHWLPAVDQVARERGWKVTTYLVSQCTVTSTPANFPTEEQKGGCLSWSERVLDETGGDAYDLVITTQRTWTLPSAVNPDDSYPSWVEGYQDALGEWADSGTRVLVIRDTPDPGTTVPFNSVPVCASLNEQNLVNCSGERSVWDRADPLVEAARSMQNSNIHDMDMNDYLCDRERCYGVIGQVVAYSDASHLTNTFSRTLAPYLNQRLTAVIAEIPSWEALSG